MKTSTIAALSAVTVMSVLGATSAHAQTISELRQSFATPPASARPWVYWFWLNSNVSKAGITADLEAMRRVGIGGVLIMDVDQGTPAGPMKFMDAQWQEMFAFAVSEAKRLGLEINMNNGAGWTGSGGPWVPPEKAMQTLASSEVHVKGGATGTQWTGTLPRPRNRVPENQDAYRDVAVVAVAEPETDPKNRFQIADFRMKAMVWGGWNDYNGTQSAPLTATAPAAAIIPRDKVVDLTARMKPDGSFTWDVPPGDWTILRIGHAYDGKVIAPASAEVRAPESDKLDKSATDLHFSAMVKRLNTLVGKNGAGALVGTHIDSWEAGAQNWTPTMRAEFQIRRGYDPVPFLPIMTGRVVGDLQTTERFLWDMRQTVSELMVENYVGEFQRLAHQNGLRFTFESYTTGGNDLDAANFVDEPMAEFWMKAGESMRPTPKSMSSAAHVNGRSVIGAEAFTAGQNERWLWHPATLKALGDGALCDGVNRFVIHRYAAQRFTDRVPGIQMGPWGEHYERTNTWWEWSLPWHTYLARSQYLLRQGQPVADVLDLQPEEALHRFQPLTLQGYDYDACSPDAFKRVSVRDGRFTFPTGGAYRLLLLPQFQTMTVPMLQHIRDYVRAGGAILGTPPQATPGLTDYPNADAQLKQLTTELWGTGAPTAARTVGKGQVFSGISVEEALAKLGTVPDFASDRTLRWIHRSMNGAEVYFVANGSNASVLANCSFRVAGKSPELWNPETGTTEPAPAFETRNGVTKIPLHFEQTGSLFVVFRNGAPAPDSVTGLSLSGKTVIPAPANPKITIVRAIYGIPGKSRDMTATVQALADAGTLDFAVTDMAKDVDPAYGIVKTLDIECRVDGQTTTLSGRDGDQISLAGAFSQIVPILRRRDNHTVEIETTQTGRYEIQLASGKKLSVNAAAIPAPQELTGPWTLSFPKGGGAPPQVQLDHLISWSQHPDAGVKYFSGTATYTKTISIAPALLAKNQRLWLDLGNVQVMAKVKLNGKDLGILWKAPYRVDITGVAKKGDNALEVQVVNLWPNRLIGDEQLPEDSQRNPDGTLKEWPQWVLDGQPSPTGRLTFSTWRLWRKDDVLQDSGLLGPVTLRAAELLPVDLDAKTR